MEPIANRCLRGGREGGREGRREGGREGGKEGGREGRREGERERVEPPNKGHFRTAILSFIDR